MFGTHDHVSVDDSCRRGWEGVVRALHMFPPARIWTPDEIRPTTEGNPAACGRDRHRACAGRGGESAGFPRTSMKQKDNWRQHIRTTDQPRASGGGWSRSLLLHIHARARLDRTHSTGDAHRRECRVRLRDVAHFDNLV